MADYRLTRVKNGWFVWQVDGPNDPQASWIAHTAAEAGEIIGREEGEGPRLATEGVKDTPEQEEGRD